MFLCKLRMAGTTGKTEVSIYNDKILQGQLVQLNKGKDNYSSAIGN